MIKIFAVCGMGLGTSTILKSRLKEALDAQDVDYSLDVIDASAAAGQDADLIFTSDELADRLRNKNAQVVVIRNFTSRSEVRDKVSEAVAGMRG